VRARHWREFGTKPAHTRAPCPGIVEAVTPDRLPLLDARRIPILACAPRLDPRLRRELARLDTPNRPIADTYRRLARFAREHGFYRPSYEHIRRLVHALRRLRAARARRRRASANVILDVAANRKPPTALMDHALDAGPYAPP
jgi:hypothetical protein